MQEKRGSPAVRSLGASFDSSSLPGSLPLGLTASSPGAISIPPKGVRAGVWAKEGSPLKKEFWGAVAVGEAIGSGTLASPTSMDLQRKVCRGILTDEGQSSTDLT